MNLGVLEAEIIMVSPVLGLRPSLSPRSRYLEGSEANQLDLASVYQFFRYYISECLDGLLCIFLGKFCLSPLQLRLILSCSFVSSS